MPSSDLPSDDLKCSWCGGEGWLVDEPERDRVFELRCETCAHEWTVRV